MADDVKDPGPLFASVDASGKVAELAGMLDRQAAAFAGPRRGWYPLLELRPGSFVIDCGCGLGGATCEMAELVGPSGRALGIDASSEMIRAAKRAANGRDLPVEFRVGDIMQVDVEDGTSDAVYCERVVQWLADREAALREMVRTLRPGGRLLVVDTDHASNAFALTADLEACDLAVRDYILEVLPHPRTGPQLPQLFRAIGLADVRFDVAAVPLSSFVLGCPLLADGVASAVRRGVLAPDRGAALVRAVQDDEASGAFFGYALLIAVIGTKPESAGP